MMKDVVKLLHPNISTRTRTRKYFSIPFPIVLAK